MKTKYILFIILLIFNSLYSYSQYFVTLYTPKGSMVEAFTRSEMIDEDIAYHTNLTQRTYPQAEVLENASTTYNCHSYAWSLAEGGTIICWLNQDPDLYKYWDDGSYEEVTEAQAVKVFYYTGDHSAVVSKTHINKYESKWGLLPLMRHSPTYGPDGYNMTKRKYYKSDIYTLKGENQLWSGKTGKYTLPNLPSIFQNQLVYSFSNVLGGVTINTTNGTITVAANEGGVRANGTITVHASVPPVFSTQRTVRVIPQYLDGYFKLPDGSTRTFFNLQAGYPMNTDLTIDILPQFHGYPIDVYLTNPYDVERNAQYTWERISVTGNGTFHNSSAQRSTVSVNAGAKVVFKITYQGQMGRLVKTLTVNGYSFSTPISAQMEKDFILVKKNESLSVDYKYVIVPVNRLTKTLRGNIQFVGGIQQIDIRNLPEGVYVFSVYDNSGEVMSNKFIIKK